MAETALRNLLRKKADVMTDICSRSGFPEVADQEEVLVADIRFGLTPSQMVDHKLAVLLGACRLGLCARAVGTQHVRRMVGIAGGRRTALALDSE